MSYPKTETQLPPPGPTDPSIVDRYREGWLSRGRDLNELYDALTEVFGIDKSQGDPVADIRALGAQRDDLREALEWVKQNYESTLAGRSVRDADECLLRAHHLLSGSC